MTRLVVIASAKGGVGKTTVAVNLCCALNNLGLDSVVVDGDLNTPNVGLQLGSSKLSATLHSVLSGSTKPQEALYIHTPSGTRLVPGDLATNTKLTGKHLIGLSRNLHGLAYVALIDSASGLGDDALGVLKSADEVIVVTTPDMPAVVDTLKTVKAAKEFGVTVRGAIVNMARYDEHELDYKNVEALLRVPVLAVIPEDDSVRESLRMKHPVVYSHPESRASAVIKKCAESFIYHDG